jgi:dTDP-4-amino-4,6-dideoxygalactose transaminase
MTGRVYLSAPDVGSLEEKYLLRALRSGWVAPVGPDLDAFEREMADRVGTAHALAVSSGTAALHLAMMALGIGQGQVVVVPTLTFAATANAVAYTGAEPVFVDCDPVDGNIDVGLLEDLLAQLRTDGTRVGAIVPVDLFGTCANYDLLLPVVEELEIPVIEDAAEALGARYGDRQAGSFGRAGVFSFNGNKIMTTSGGGMLVSDDSALLAECRYLSTQARQPVTYYEHIHIGYNYRLSNLLAAVGRAQLRRLDGMMARRRRLRDRYREVLAGVDGVRLLGDRDTGANCWLTTVVVDPEVAGWKVADLSCYLATLSIETRPVWKPMHLQPVFAGSRAALTGAAARLFETGLTLPSGSALDDVATARVLKAIRQFLDGDR